MKFSDLKGKAEGELKVRLKELANEGFKARFTTEPNTPARGAKARVRRNEVARIMTVLNGRVAYDRAVATLKAVDERIAALGKADPHDAAQRERLAAALRRKKQLERSKRELASLKGK